LGLKGKLSKSLRGMSQNKPKVLEKIADGIRHAKHGFLFTYKDAIYFYRL